MTMSPAKRTVLRDMLDDRCLKYSGVASKLGMSPQSFSRLLVAERTLTASDLVTLCELLNCDASAFFDGRELLPSRQTQEDVGADDVSGGGHIATPPALGATA